MRPKLSQYNTANKGSGGGAKEEESIMNTTTTTTTKENIENNGRCRYPLEAFAQHYLVGEEIGSGKFATVKHCIRRECAQEFAAKFIKKSRSSRFGQKVEDIELEIDILNDLKHDNIINLVDIFEDGHQVILVFELMKGGELQDYIADYERLTESVTKDFLIQILSALAYMHQKSIVHLDLKPENILLHNLDDNRLKIIDFGISRRFSQKSEIKGIYGTPEFIAPEILNYENVSYGTDMWAIGCIGYTMLFGVSPFFGETKQDIYANITRATFDFDVSNVDWTPSELAQDFITKLLVRDARKRMTAIDALQHPWLVPVPNDRITIMGSVDSESTSTMEHLLVDDDEDDDDDQRKHEEDMQATFVEIELHEENVLTSDQPEVTLVNYQARSRWRYACRLVVYHNRHQRRKAGYKTLSSTLRTTKTLSPIYYRRVVSRNSTGTATTDCSSGCSQSNASADVLSSHSLNIEGDFGQVEETLADNDSSKDNENFLLAALFGAIEEGNLHSIEEIFTSSHIDPNACNRHNESLLHYCAGLGQLPIFKYLLSAGADIGIIDDQGDTVLHWASRGNHADLIRYIYEQTMEVNHVNRNGETPLHVGARYGHVEAVEKLCKCGANIDAVDEHGETAILIAVWHGFPKIVHILCEIGADTNLKNKEDDSPLHVSAARGHLTGLRFLLEAGGDPNLKNKKSFTPLHLALQRQHVAVALLLLKAGADFEMPDIHGERVIHYAARYNLLPICQWLTTQRPPCQVNVPNNQGQSPLHIAAKAGHIDVVRMLCLAGSIVDQKDKDMIIPQICAMAQSHNDIADLLTRLRNEQHKEEFIAQLTATTQPLTRVKLNVFGHHQTGKTTLIESMKCSYFGSWFRRSKVLSSSSLGLRKTGMTTSAAGAGAASTTSGSECNISTISNNSTLSSSPTTTTTTTNIADFQAKGIDCQQVYISGVGDLSIWEFSGHPVYYQVYDHFIGHDDIGNCLNAIVFRLSDRLPVQLESITFWLTLLQSRIPVHEPLYEPLYGGKVILIATHADLVNGGSGSYYTRPELDGTVRAQLGELWTQITTRFGNIFDIHRHIFMIDANVAGSAGIKELKAHLATAKQSMVQELPFTTQFLDSVLTFLNLYRKASANFPVLALHQFKDMIRSQINPLASDDHFKQLVQQLEFMGEIVFLRATSLSIDLIVLNAKWLNCDILGKLLLLLVNSKTATTGAHRPNLSQLMGIYSIDEFQEEFPDVDALDLLQLLESMSLCVQNDRSGDIEYEFPCFIVRGDLDTVIEKFCDQETCVYHGVIYQLESVGKPVPKELGGAETEADVANPFGCILTSIFPRVQVALRSELHKHPLYDLDDLHNCLNFSYFHATEMMGTEMSLWAIISVDSEHERIEARFCGPADARSQCFFLMQELLSIVERTIVERCLPGILIEKWYYSPEQLRTQRDQVSYYTSSQVMRAMLQTNGSAALRRKVKSADGKAEERVGEILCFGIVDLDEISLGGGGGGSHTRSRAQSVAKSSSLLLARNSPTSGSTTTSGISESTAGDAHQAHPPTLVNQLHCSNLSALTKQRLCALLDPPESIGRDWCMLGILLGMTDKLPKLDPGNAQHQQQQVSPTARLLEECVRNPQCTIKVLVDKLSELNRFDAVDVILRTAPLLRIFPLSSLPEEGVVYNDESSHTSLGVGTLSHTSSSNLSR